MAPCHGVVSGSRPDGVAHPNKGEKYMRISIMSRKEAWLVSKMDWKGEKTIIVSINEPGYDAPPFQNKDLLAIFPMFFWDIEQPVYDLEPATREDIKGIKEFIDKYKNQAEHIIVHCAAGISRSSATAAAISDYLGIEHHIFFDRRYSPNMHVYKLMQEEFSIAKSQKFYDELFKNHKASLFEGQDIEF